MIQKISHVTIYVNDQEEALKFYTEKLGFEVRTDVTMDPTFGDCSGFRWLTVGPKGQKDVEIVLMEPKAGKVMDDNTVKNIKSLISQGALGAGVFTTADCKATYQELKQKGVEFIMPPEEKPYGIEALFKDNSGNWFSLTQPR